MQNIHVKWHLWILTSALSALVGCAGGASSGELNDSTVPMAPQAAKQKPSAFDRGSTSQPPVTQKIYVTSGYGASSMVTTYNLDGSQTTPTIRSGLNGPTGIGVDGLGRIHVANSGGGTITTYASDGSQIAPTIQANYGLDGLAADKSGNVYVASHGWKRVFAYFADGKPMPMSIPVFFPISVAVDPLGKVYVANVLTPYAVGHTLEGGVNRYDWYGHRIRPTIYHNPAPWGVTVDANGKVYVATYVAHTVYTFNSDGSPASPTIAGLEYPLGIAVDATGKIYVVDIGTETINTYNADGSRTTPTISLPSGARFIAIH